MLSENTHAQMHACVSTEVTSRVRNEASVRMITWQTEGGQNFFATLPSRGDIRVPPVAFGLTFVTYVLGLPRLSHEKPHSFC